jgi:NhaP-type Na+/H+ or K+/H+ antiporter
MTGSRNLSASVVMAISGLVAIALYFLALGLPGQSGHGSGLTIVTLLFGIYVPPSLFAAGLILGLLRRRQHGYRGLWLNSAGLLAHALWVTGLFDRVLG